MNRRSFLQTTTGVAIGASVLSGGTVAADDDEYDVVVNVVEDLDVDNTGQQMARRPINNFVLDEDSVKFVFPEGEYWLPSIRIWNGPDQEPSMEKLAIVGEEDAEVRFVCREGFRSTLMTLRARELHLENFIMDTTEPDTSTGLTVNADDSLVVRNVLLDGKATGDYVQTPHWQDDDYDPDEVLDDPFAINPAILNEDGEGIIEHFRAPDGVEPYSRKGGSWVSFNHAGDLLFKNCEFSNMSDNALYASPPGILDTGQGGSVRVENSYFENNNVTSIRLGSPGSYGKNCTVITEPDEVPATPWGAITSRAGWVWYNFDGYYENIDVIHDHESGYGILDHGDNTRDLHLEVRDCRFALNNAGGQAIVFVNDGVESLTVEDFHITGEDDGTSDDPLIDLANCSVDITDLCIDHGGNDRDAITVSNVTGDISDSSIHVDGEQFAEGEESGLDVENVDEDANCIEPDPASKIEPLDDDDTDETDETDDAEDDDDPTVTDDVDDDDQTDTDTPEDDTEDDGLPGFSVAASAVAILSAAGAMAHRLRGNRGS